MTAKLPTNCEVCDTKLTRSNRCEAIDFRGMCEACYDYAGWENTHSDDAHEAEGNKDDSCPVCQGIALTNAEPEVRGTKGWNSHKGHLHPATSAGRAACRKATASA